MLRSESIYDHHLGASFAVLNHFQDGFAAQPGASSEVSQQQEAPSEQPSQVPVVKIYGSAKNMPPKTSFPDRGHIPSA
jgi:hypothetical protein